MKSKPKKIQSRTWGLIIPCKWDNCMRIVHRAKQLAKYYYWIMHDWDYYAEPEEGADNPRQPGELKDPHIHLLFTFNSSRDLSTVQNYFREFEELKDNSYEKIANAFGAKRYLVHADNPEKHQYQIFEVETNDKLYSNVFIEKISADEEIRSLREAMKFSDNISFEDYYQKFAPLLAGMNSYGKTIVSFQIKSEWRRIVSGHFVGGGRND